MGSEYSGQQTREREVLFTRISSNTRHIHLPCCCLHSANDVHDPSYLFCLAIHLPQHASLYILPCRVSKRSDTYCLTRFSASSSSTSILLFCNNRKCRFGSGCANAHPPGLEGKGPSAVGGFGSSGFGSSSSMGGGGGGGGGGSKS